MFQEEEELFSDLFGTPHDHQSQSSSSSMSSLFRDIEHKLLNDNDEENNDYLADEFFSDIQLPSSLLQPPQSQYHIDSSQSQSQDQDISMDDLLVDVPPTTPPPLNTNNSPSHSSSNQLVVTTMGAPAPLLILNDPETSTPESQVSFQDDDQQEDNNQENTGQNELENTSFDVNQAKENTTDSTALEDKEDDDPITKKRKRQMRNRDAAVRSRERKKMYVKDLEVKSKYLEAECIRLQRLLQCCAAENHALHLQLQEKAFSASRTKQESAVLFLESLLLGSLLWFLGLFSPEMLRVQLPANLLVNAEKQKVVDLVALGRAKSKSIGLGTLRLFFKTKRCKASRSKMKILICNGAVVA
ncbi:bZIP transcription factor 60-like [Thalictrum thalictroides]|uniref:BZIP transcription factor 60-like n=1 Tax=Thalictrum thalictroides TaxID=46969 RepID=A0A7J6V065_THATH|nr:bZIP transcription factor 60-like [Thalictrum thalictroides]